MNSDSCNSDPRSCGLAIQAVNSALDGFVPAVQLAQLRGGINDCLPCVQAFDMQIQFRVAMAQGCHEAAPESLKIRISEAMQRIDLSQIDVTDL